MHYKEYKHILSPKNGMNIYRGCSHGCIYCDSRSKCYQMDHDFEDIEIKKDAPIILERELRSKRNLCMIGTGAMCDPYLHLEKELQYTRQCLEVIEKYGFGISIQTKSNLILRDMDILQKINKKAKCVVEVTITTSDEKLCRIIEPNVSTTKERFDILKNCKELGIPTIVWFDPLLPFINDTEDNMLDIIYGCMEQKVKGILCFGIGLTLRDGNREYFYQKLDEHFPGLKQKYISTYGNSYMVNSPNNSRLMTLFKKICIKQNIMYKPKDIFEYLWTFETHENEQLSLF